MEEQHLLNEGLDELLCPEEFRVDVDLDNDCGFYEMAGKESRKPLKDLSYPFVDPSGDLCAVIKNEGSSWILFVARHGPLHPRTANRFPHLSYEEYELLIYRENPYSFTGFT